MKSKWNETFGSVIFGMNVIHRTWSASQEVTEAATSVEGTPTPTGRAPLSRGLLDASLACTLSSRDYFCSKNNFSEGFIPFGLRLIFLFFETLK